MDITELQRMGVSVVVMDDSKLKRGLRISGEVIDN
jgi:hypothetical protein